MKSAHMLKVSEEMYMILVVGHVQMVSVPLLHLSVQMEHL